MGQLMGVRVALAVVVTLMMLARWLLVPGAPDHPYRDCDDQEGRCELKIRLCKSGIVPGGEMQAEQRHDPDRRGVRDRRRDPSNTACATVARTAMMNAAIMVLLCPGSKPCRAPSTRALDSSSGAGAALDCSKSVREVMTGSGQRYLVIALNSSTGVRCSRGSGPTACSRQFSMWS